MGDTCTVNVNFKPKYAGARDGAVVLSDASGVIATAYVYGIGRARKSSSSRRRSRTLGGGFSNPAGVAVDGSGNVYVADTTTTR